jgi:hypothetical protein
MGEVDTKKPQNISRVSVAWSVGPHITLNVFFSAVRRQVDLKFGRDLYVNLLFQFLLFFFLAPPLTRLPTLCQSTFLDCEAWYKK